MPRPSKQRGPADSASNTTQYSQSAWRSQPPEGDIFFPVLRIAGGVLPGHKEGKEHAMPRHSYREHDYALGRRC